jgi:hypothetical protein
MVEFTGVTTSGVKLNFSGSISRSGGLNLQPALFGVGNVQLSGSTGNLEFQSN